MRDNEATRDLDIHRSGRAARHRGGGCAFSGPMHIDALAAAVGRRQLGLASRGQLLSAGIGGSAVDRRLRSGVWTSDGRVVDLRTHAATWRQAVLRAVLGAPDGALASHRTAAHLHGFLDVGRPATIELTVARSGRNATTGVVLHSSTQPDVGTVVSAVPSVRWPRAARELAPLLPRRVYGRLISSLLRERAGAPRLLVAELEACAATTAGVGVLRSVLRDELGSDRALLESPLEDRWHRALERAGLTPPAVQHVLRPEDGHVLARFDLAWPAVRFALEVDGRDHHAAAADAAAAARRDDHAGRLGWRVERVGSAQLRPPLLADTLALVRRHLSHGTVGSDASV